MVIILITVVFGFDQVQSIFVTINNKISNPIGTGTFTASVSENQQPYFIDPYSAADWWGRLGYFFITFLFGTILLFYWLVRKLDKYKYILTGAFIVFITFMVFSRFSPDPKYEVVNKLFGENYLTVAFGDIRSM